MKSYSVKAGSGAFWMDMIVAAESRDEAATLFENWLAAPEQQRQELEEFDMGRDHYQVLLDHYDPEFDRAPEQPRREDSSYTFDQAHITGSDVEADEPRVVEMVDSGPNG